ncbi:MAG: DMT family transporter [Opitutaceae bacterium]|nr:DMT family transporter [Opitutaceae bacterium]
MTAVTAAGAAQRPALGVAMILVMAVCFAGLDTSVRHLGAFFPVLLLLTARYGFQALVMALWLALHRGQRFASAHPRFQALRGSLLLATSAMSFYGLQQMPVPEFTAIIMLTPVLVTLLAAWLLAERVSALRWALVIGGCAGALIVIRPGSGLFGWAVLYPLAGACTYALFQVLTSRLAALENPLTTHFWTGLVGTAILLPLLLASPLDVTGTLAGASPGQWGMLLLIGVLGTGGHLMLILALGLAPSATLMPFTYAQIGAAALLGWLVFQQLPDSWGWLGMLVITVCGAASAWLNVRSAAAARRPLSVVTADSAVD